MNTFEFHSKVSNVLTRGKSCGDICDNKKLNIKVKLSGKCPTKGSNQAAAWDLYSLNSGVVPVGKITLIKSGVSMSIPVGWMGQIYSRSSLARKHHVVTEGGVIDSDYRGDIGILLANHGDKDFVYAKHERIAQIRFEKVPDVQFHIVDELDDTKRGVKGYGSSGKM